LNTSRERIIHKCANKEFIEADVGFPRDIKKSMRTARPSFTDLIEVMAMKLRIASNLGMQLKNWSKEPS
jgi:hypothetical protein